MQNDLYKIIPSILVLALLYPCAGIANAQTKEKTEHISTGRILEFSLRNLKEGLERAKQKNERLAFENTALRKDIRYLEGVLRNLNERKNELLGGEQMPSIRESPYAIAESYDLEERKRRTDDLIQLFRQDVLELSEEMHLLDRQIEQNSYTAQREQLLEKKAASEAYIAKAEKRIKTIERKLKGPRKKLEKLNEENEILRQQLEILKEKFANF